MSSQTVHFHEDQRVSSTLKIVFASIGALVGIGFMTAIVYSGMGFNVEKVEARVTRIEVNLEKGDIALAARLAAYNLEKLDNARFQAKVLEKLERIERNTK